MTIQFENEKKDLEATMRSKKETKKKTMTLRLRQKEQQQTAELVRKQSQVMLEMLAKEQQELKAELAREINLVRRIDFSVKYSVLIFCSFYHIYRYVFVVVVVFFKGVVKGKKKKKKSLLMKSFMKNNPLNFSQAGNAQNGGSVKALPVQNGDSGKQSANGQGAEDALDEVLDILPLPAMVAPPSPEAPTCRKEELVPDETVFESIDEQVIKVGIP